MMKSQVFTAQLFPVGDFTSENFLQLLGRWNYHVNFFIDNHSNTSHSDLMVHQVERFDPFLLFSENHCFNSSWLNLKTCARSTTLNIDCLPMLLSAKSSVLQLKAAGQLTLLLSWIHHGQSKMSKLIRWVLSPELSALKQIFQFVQKDFSFNKIRGWEAIFSILT